MRNAFADAVYDLAKQDSRVCVVVADISPAGSMERFRVDFPDRFVNVGIAEQAMIGIAAGMAQRGMRPFCYTIAPFALFRPFEFIRCDLAYQDVPVVVVGMGAGLSYSTLGPTHHATEDVAVACACPNLSVLTPCDPADVRACVSWCMSQSGPTYLRLGKVGEPDLPDLGPAASLGDMRWLRFAPRDRVRQRTVLTYGPVAEYALRAYSLRNDAVVGIRIIRPLPARVIEDLLRAMQSLVVLEEASGAPLYRDVLAVKAALRSTPRCSVQSLALPRGFIHDVGMSREELLRAALCGDLS